MKKLTLFALAAALVSPAVAQDAPLADPQVSSDEAAPVPAADADTHPETHAAMDHAHHDAATHEAITSDEYAIADEAASFDAAETWNDLDDTSRFLLIMGTADGFSAAGAGAPCFPGEDNSSLDANLKSTGFGEKDPATLTPALAALSAPANQCASIAKRGYAVDLLKSMPDEHLAAYLTGAVRGYAHIKTCPEINFSYAAATATAAVFTAEANAAPSEVLGAALAEGCLGVQDPE